MQFLPGSYTCHANEVHELILRVRRTASYSKSFCAIMNIGIPAKFAPRTSSLYFRETSLSLTDLRLKCEGGAPSNTVLAY